jgi:hypothetical protein
VWSFPPLKGEVPLSKRLKKTTVVSIIGRANVSIAESTRFSGDIISDEDVPFHKKSMLSAAKKRPKNCVPVSPIYILEGCQLKNRNASMHDDVPSISIKNMLARDFSRSIRDIIVQRAPNTTIEAMASILSSRLIAFIRPTIHNIVIT